MAGESWILVFHCEGAPAGQEFIEKEMDRADISFYNLICLKGELGYSGRDYLYYKKRRGRDVATLELIDFEHEALRMITESERERKVRFLLTRDVPTELQVSISPIKRSRELPISELVRDETLDAYKVWLEELLDEQPDTDSSQARNKGGRGTLKGLSAAKKRIKNGPQKLEIQFSTRLGGPIGINSRSFLDEVVMCTRKRAPLIGVTKWKDIKQNVKNSIASDVLNMWDLKNTMSAKKKIWDVAKERYKGWRSTLSSTYRAYSTYADLMKHKPEDVDIVEWHCLILYFGSDKFKKLSKQNFENCHKQKTKHLMGSKSFSQFSCEQRDPETGEEPNDLSLWMGTHMKNGQWSNPASKDVYDNACFEICERELETERDTLSDDEQNNIFQSSYKASTGCKTSQLHGHGYMSKRPTPTERMHAKIDEQAPVTAATQRQNVELHGEVQNLREQLANERAERDRLVEESRCQIQEERNARLALREQLREELREEMMSMLEQHREASTQQSDPTSINPSVEATRPVVGKSNINGRTNVVRSLFQNTKSNGTGSYISSQQLRQAAKNHGRPRTEQE